MMKRLIMAAIVVTFLIGFGATDSAIAQTGYDGGGNNFYVTWCKDFQNDHPSAFNSLWKNLGECINAGNNDYYYVGFCKWHQENDPDFYLYFDNLGDCVSSPVKWCRYLKGGIAPELNLGACVTFRKHSPFEP